MDSAGDVQTEREVPPRGKKLPLLSTYLSRHPLLHFGMTFCYFFTFISLFNSLAVHVLQFGERWSESHRNILFLFSIRGLLWNASIPDEECNSATSGF